MMMNRYRFYIVSVLVIGFSIVLLLYFLTTMQPTYRINRQAFERIELGFTESQVNSILGTSPGLYCSSSTRTIGGPLLNPALFSSKGVMQDDGSIAKGWMSDEGFIIILFDYNGRVVNMGFDIVICNETSFWERVRKALNF